MKKKLDAGMWKLQNKYLKSIKKNIIVIKQRNLE